MQGVLVKITFKNSRGVALCREVPARWMRCLLSYCNLSRWVVAVAAMSGRAVELSCYRKERMGECGLSVRVCSTKVAGAR